MSQESRFKCKLGRRGRWLAAGAPLVDCVSASVAAGVWLRDHDPAAFGWSPHAPLVFAVLRLCWLAAVAALAVVEGAGRGCPALLLAENICEVAFPYVFSLLLASLGVSRLVSDQPADLPSADTAGFWTSVLFGAACVALETYFTLEALPALRGLVKQRVELRTQLLAGRAPGVGGLTEGSSNLGSELLGVDAEAQAASCGSTASTAVGGCSPEQSSREDREARERAEEEEKKAKEDEQRGATVKKLFNMVAFDWPLLIQAAFFLIGAAVAEASIPFFVGQAVDDIKKAEAEGTLSSRPYEKPVACMLVAGAFSGVFSACRGATFIWLTSRFSVRMRHSLYDALAHQEIGFFDTTKTGELTSRMTQDCQKVSDQVMLNINVLLRYVIQLFVTLGFMFTISPKLTLVAFVSVPAIVVISKKYGAWMRKMSEATQKALADANAVAEEGMSSMSTVRMFAAEGLESQRFGEKLNDFGKLMRAQARFYLPYMSCTTFLPYGVMALIIFYGGKLTMQKDMQASQVVQVVLYLPTLNSCFSTIGDFYTGVVQAIGAATRVFELKSREPELPLQPPPGAAPAPRFPEGDLRLEGLRFCYPARPSVEVLADLTLHIPAGQVVALVGPSGNGKSTVIGLLKRLYKAKEGRVLLDGVDVWDFEHEAYHRTVSIVGQEPVLYCRTIRENIVFGLENPRGVADGGASSSQAGAGTSGCGLADKISDEQVFEAARKANAHDFISGLPDGYDTEVGERGVQLSGGQKQRIAIARALVRKPKVLLLDEATSALDAESERQVQSAIDCMIADGSMTVVIIAHRLSTVRNSHKICVVKDGQVVEEGPHDELVAKKGAYFRLVECQLSGGQTSSPTASPTAEDA